MRTDSVRNTSAPRAAHVKLDPWRDEHERSAGSDLDSKVMVAGENMPALPPDVVEREKV